MGFRMKNKKDKDLEKALEIAFKEDLKYIKKEMKKGKNKEEIEITNMFKKLTDKIIGSKLKENNKFTIIVTFCTLWLAGFSPLYRKIAMELMKDGIEKVDETFEIEKNIKSGKDIKYIG